MRWIDLSEHGVELMTMTFPDKRQRLVLRGETSLNEWGIVNTLGFEKTKAGFFVRDDLTVSKAQFQQVFAKLKIVDMPVSRVRRIVSGEGDRVRVQQELALRQATPLGTNHLGQEVFEGVMGRFVRSGDAVVTEQQGKSPAVYLRAINDEALAQCADAFVSRMTSGRNFKTGDFEAYARVIFDVSALPKGDDRLAKANAALELAMARNWASHAQRADRAAFGAALRIHEAQPAKQNAVRREATPLPVISAIARIVRSFSPKRVGVVQAGSGAIAYALDGIDVVASDSDPQYEAGAYRVSSANLSWQKIDAKSCDVSVGLPSVRTSPGNTYSGVFLNRTDHICAMHVLAARPNDAASVLLLGGDSSTDSGTGDVTQSKDFLDWLYQNYEVKGAVEVEGALTRKQPDAWPHRVVVVGNKRPAPDAKQQCPAYLPVISSYEDLWAFSTSFDAPSAVQAPARVVLTDFPTPTPAMRPAAQAVAEVAQEAVAAPIASDADVITADMQGQPVQSQENIYQAPYTPFSKAGEPEAMIPRNLVAPTYKALSRVAKTHGDIDGFVIESLGLSGQEELSNAFSAEQVDALALAVDAMGRGKGFIEGDMTGLGKGRVLSGVARWAFTQKKNVVFITEKANLFSDFWRDLSDTGAAPLVRPFLVNAGAGIIDSSGQKVHKAPKKDIQDAIFNGASDVWGEGYNVVFSTYSQFSRSADSSPKAAWLPKICKDAVVILDESHNAAGDSQVNKNIELALEGASSVIYSSATFAKTAQNMAIYGRVFPDGLNSDELKETLEAGGEPLNEVLSAALAEDGVFVRREHDMSQLTFETVVDHERLPRNEHYADEMADVLMLMARASRQAESIMQVAAARDAKAMYTVPNFGGMRYLASRHFMLSLNIDKAIDSALEALQSGEKPVLVVESTMESLIRDAALDEDMSDDDLLDGDIVDGAIAPVEEKDIRAVTFKDVIAKVFDRCISVKRRAGDTSERIHALDLNVPDSQKAELRRLRERAMSIIQRFDGLSASPLDAFRNALAKFDYKCGEISGRGIRLEELEDGRQRVVSAQSMDRAQIVRSFNSGDLDAIMLTRSGSTGISLHNSKLFEDRRPRVMIEAQIFNNVAERVQVYGRCNRKGQESAPTILTLSTGLPGEVRSLGMQRKKLRALSANTTSNRENAVDSDDVVDLLNPLGDEVARNYLQTRPAIAERLGINAQREKEDAADIFVVNALMSRIEMLKTAEQRDVIGDIESEYNAKLAELDAQGLNPFKLTRHDWRAKVISSTVFEPAQSSDSVLDRPVLLNEIEYIKEQNPMRGKAVVKHWQDDLDELGADLRVAALTRGAKNRSSFVAKAMIDAAYVNVTALQQESIGKFKSVAAALADGKTNAVKLLHEKYDQLRIALDSRIEHGKMITFNHAGEAIRGVVVGLKLPPSGKEHLLGQYEVKVIQPGESHPQSFTLNTILSGDLKVLARFKQDAIETLFDAAPSGRVSIRRLVLDGNLFRSSQYAVRHELGHSVSYVDDAGVTKRAVLLNKAVGYEDVMKLPVRLGDAKMVSSWLKTGEGRVGVYSNAEFGQSLEQTVKLERIRDGYLIDLPRSGQFMNVRKDKKILALVGKLRGRNSFHTSFDESKLARVVDRLSELGVHFYAPADARKWVASYEPAPVAKKASQKLKR